ncbi:MAG: SipW-dependent-type signal peptide-containing protein [Candidatus Limnocylindrales bacterium]
MRRLRLRATLVAAVTIGCLLSTGTGSALALFTSTKSAGSNTFTTGTWAYYLDNNPTPPTANTTAQYNLTMTLTVPTAPTLFNYDTDHANRPGRGITRNNPPSPGLVTAFRYVNWQTSAFASGLTLSGTVTVDVWSATNSGVANRNGSLIAYLRDYNPGTGTYVEIANATRTAAYAAGRTYYETPITVTVSPAYSIPAGHALEVKLESPTAISQNNMLVAYDTTTYPSVLRVR